MELGEIVVAYIEHLEEAGELDLEAATEFLVLIASLLELKSRLLLPAPEEGELELGPEEAADELLARMLEYRRYRDAGGPSGRPVRRRAPLPVPARAAAAGAAARLARGREPRCTSRSGSREALGDLLRVPPEPDTSHIRPTVSLERRLAVLRELLGRRGRFDFDELFADEDRLTQAVTLFALLEMHKRGEATLGAAEAVRPDRGGGVIDGPCD